MAHRKLEIVDFAIKGKRNFQDMKKSVEDYERQSKADRSLEDKMQNLIPSKVQEQIINRFNKEDIRISSSSSKTQKPNTELIRLLKKEKLSNEILEQTLNDAIEKN